MKKYIDDMANVMSELGASKFGKYFEKLMCIILAVPLGIIFYIFDYTPKQPLKHE